MSWEGAEGKERAGQLWSALREHAGAPAQPSVSVGGGFVLAVLQCAAVQLACHSCPSPCQVWTVQRQTLPNIMEPGPIHGISRAKHSNNHDLVATQRLLLAFVPGYTFGTILQPSMQRALRRHRAALSSTSWRYGEATVYLVTKLYRA